MSEPRGRTHRYLSWTCHETGRFGVSCLRCHKTWESWRGDLIPTHAIFGIDNWRKAYADPKLDDPE